MQSIAQAGLCRRYLTQLPNPLPYLQALALAGKTQREAMRELGLPEDCSLQAFWDYLRFGWQSADLV